MSDKHIACVNCDKKNRENCDYNDSQCQWHEYVKTFKVGPGEDTPSQGSRIVPETSAASSTDAWGPVSSALEKYRQSHNKALLNRINDLEKSMAEVEGEMEKLRTSEKARKEEEKDAVANAGLSSVQDQPASKKAADSGEK